MAGKISEEDYNNLSNKDKEKYVCEFKRTCNECTKVWHVLQSRENEINKKIKDSRSSQNVAACGMCGGSYSAQGAATQAKHSENALEEELNRLRQCPNCSSSNYTEEKVIYEKK